MGCTASSEGRVHTASCRRGPPSGVARSSHHAREAGRSGLRGAGTAAPGPHPRSPSSTWHEGGTCGVERVSAELGRQGPHRVDRHVSYGRMRKYKSAGHGRCTGGRSPALADHGTAPVPDLASPPRHPARAWSVTSPMPSSRCLRPHRGPLHCEGPARTPRVRPSHAPQAPSAQPKERGSEHTRATGPRRVQDQALCRSPDISKTAEVANHHGGRNCDAWFHHVCCRPHRRLSSLTAAAFVKGRTVGAEGHGSLS